MNQLNTKTEKKNVTFSESVEIIYFEVTCSRKKKNKRVLDFLKFFKQTCLEYRHPSLICPFTYNIICMQALMQYNNFQ